MFKNLKIQRFEDSKIRRLSYVLTQIQFSELLNYRDLYCREKNKKSFSQRMQISTDIVIAKNRVFYVKRIPHSALLYYQ